MSTMSAIQLLEEGFNYLYVTSQFDKAVQVFDRVLEECHSNKDALYHKGVAYYVMGKYAESIQLQDQVLQQDKKYLWSYVIKGNAYNEQGQFTQALQTYQECSAQAPEWDVSRNAQGNCYFLQERYGEAVEMYDRSIQLTLMEYALNGISRDENWKHCSTCLTLLNKGLAMLCIHRYFDALFCFRKYYYYYYYYYYLILLKLKEYI
jgi:tetratricopeptide (TPR) repeat protein